MRSFPLLALLLAAASPAAAITSQISILLDTDESAATGCTVATADGPFAGVEQRLDVEVETAGDGTATVVEVARRECVGGAVFGPPVVTGGGWPVGIGIGEDGSHVVEACLERAALGDGVTRVRVGVVHGGESGDDALLTTAPASTQPIVILIASVIEIPTLSEWAALLLIGLLAVVALRALGRRETVAFLLLAGLTVGTGTAWAAVVLDGQIGDWSAADRRAVDGIEDADESVDLVALFAQVDGEHVCFRVDTFLRFDEPPVAVDDAATVTEDAPATTIDVLANDTDADGGTISITSVTQPANGTVVITNAGADLTYQPNPDFCNDGSPVDTFTYTLNGGSTATVSVTVTCVDDAPAAVDDAATVGEDSPATTIDVLANDTDGDGGPISITSVTQPANGTVVITNAGADLTYQPNPDYCNSPPGTTLDTFTYTLTPGGSTATVSVTVTCEDDAPTAVADAATVAEDSGANAIDVLANDTDPDAGPISVTSVTQPANGTVVITGGGSGVTYTPNADYCNDPPGTSLDTFTYTLNGGSSATVTVTVTCADDPPTAVADAATVGEDDPATTIDVLANDVDLDGGAIAVGAVTQPANGTVVITNAGADLSYTPNADYCNDPPGTSPDTFTYTLAPGGSMATVSVTVTCVNDGPLVDLDADDDKGTGGNDFAATFTEANPATLIVDPDDPTGAIVTDIDSATLATLTVTITNLLDAGQETLSADTTGTSIVASYVAATGVLTLTGPDTLANYTTVLRTVRYHNSSSTPDETARVVHFVANDGSSDGNTAVSTVTVVAADTAPTAVDDTATVNEDSGANAIDVLANDTDPDGGAISVTSVTQPANGTVAITGGGTGVTYTPNANYCNSVSGIDDTFTYTLAPGGSTATVSVTVTCVDDNPVAVADAATVAEDSGASAVDVLANDTDADGGPISVTSVTQPANGTVAITGGGTGLTYTPNANYCNTPPGTTLDTFTYTLTPGGSSTTVTVTVTCVDDDPVAVADAATVVEDSGANAIDVLANDTDADGGLLEVQSVTQPTNGAVAITGGGTGLTYTPNANYCNNPPGSTLETFTYTLTPGGSSTTVTVTVTCVDDPPTAVADAATVLEDSGANTINVQANDTDVDGGTNTIQSVTQPAGGAVAITNAGADLTYTPNLNFCNDGSPLDTFTYTLNGGSSTTVSMTVTCINDPPVAGADAFDFVGNTELRVDHGTTATPHALETTTGGTGVLENDSDPVEGDPISIVGLTVGACIDNSAPFDCTDAAVGRVQMDGDGSFSFQPAAGDAGASESFQYTLSDGTDTTTGTVTLTRFERVWYVDPNAGAGDGTSDSPLNVLDSLDGVGGAGDSDFTGDYVFVHDGTLALSAPMEMEASQHLVGEGVGLSVPVNLNGNGSPTVLVAAGTQPQLTNATGDAVRVTQAIPVEIVGLSLRSNAGNAIDLTSAAALTGSGTLTIANNQFRGASAEGIDVNLNALTTGTLALAVSNNTWDLAGTHAGNAVDVNRLAGTLHLAFNGNTGIVSNASGVVINGGAVANTTITGFAGNSVHQNTAGAGVSISNVTFDAVAGGGVQQVDGDNLAIGVSGDHVGAAGMTLSTVQGSLFFDDLDVYGGTSGLTVAGTGSMTFAVTPASPDGIGTSVIRANNGAALDVTSTTIDLRLDDLDGTISGNGSALTFSSVAGQFKTDGDASLSKTGGTGTGLSVASSSVTVTYAGTLTVTSGAGVSLSGNTGTTSFSGGMTLSTGANAGFAATGGGTVTVTDPAGVANNTITTTSGTALNVNGTTIGAADLTFERISAGTSGSPANGIVLNNTGALGELIVTGGVGACSSAGTCTGGAIQNTTGDGISLTSTRAPSFTRMFVGGSGRHGISATSLSNGLTLANGFVQNSGNADNEYGLNISNVAGTVAISGTTFNNAADDLIHYVNLNTNGTLTVNGASSFIYPAVVGGTANAAIALQPNGTSTLTATIQNNTFTNIVSSSIQWGAATAASNGTSTLDFSSNTITVNMGGRGSGFQLSCQESTTGNVTIANNNFSGAGGNGVVSIDCNDSSLLSGTISGNVISNPPGIGMFVAVDEAAEARLTLTGNTITNSGGDGIQVVNFGGVGVSDLFLAITNNQINGHSLNTTVNFVGGVSVTSFEDNACIEVRGNSVTGTPAGATHCGGLPCVDYYIEEVGGTMTFEEVPNTASATLNAAYLNSINDAGPVTIFGTIDLTNGAQCPFP